MWDAAPGNCGQIQSRSWRGYELQIAVFPLFLLGPQINEVIPFLSSNASLKTGIGYYFSDDPQIMTEEWAVMQAMVAGDLTPEEAMAQMDELLQRLISEKE